MKILIVEDEPKVGNALSEGLRASGYEVTLAQRGEDGFFLASSQSFDLIVLDVMLPGRSGIEVLKTLRKQGLQIPVLLLTAKDAIEDRVLGLDAGADDYLVKPFAFPELGARLRALLRRGKTETVV
jgi:two-component system copper resistance phosphate regulon response regulator CusR